APSGPVVAESGTAPSAVSTTALTDFAGMPEQSPVAYKEYVKLPVGMKPMTAPPRSAESWKLAPVTSVPNGARPVASLITRVVTVVGALFTMKGSQLLAGDFR